MPRKPPQWWTGLPRLWRRALLFGASLLALYATAGFLVAPALLRAPLERHAGALLGRRVALARLRFNPLALSVTADGLSITDPDGTPLLRWERLYVNFQALSSLFHRAWVFRDVQLLAASGRLAMAPGGTLNIDDIVARLAAAPAEPQGPAPVVRVRRLRVEDATLSFVDRSGAQTFTTTLGPLRLDLRDFTSRSGERNTYSFTGRTEAAESFSWSGQFALGPLRSEGEFTLERVALDKYHPYYRGRVPFDIRGGSADVRSGYRFAWGPTERTVSLVDASVSVRELRLSESGKEEIAVDAPTIELADGNIDLLTGAVSIGRIATRGGRIILRRSADGLVNLLEMLLPFYATPAEPATAAPPATAQPFSLAEIDFADYTVDAEDLAQPRPVNLRLDQIHLTLRGVDNVPGTTAKGALDVRWNGEGTLHAEGDLSLVGLVEDLRIKLDGIDVTPLGPYVDPVLDMRITNGTLFAEGSSRASLIDPARPEFSFRGNARMDDFRSVDGARREEFLRWKSLRLADLDYSLQQDRLRIGDLTIVGAEAVLTQEADGSTNLATILRLPVPATEPAESSEDRGAAAAETDASPTVNPAEPATLPTDGGDTRIARARVQGSRIRVVDRSMTPPVELGLTRIEGTLAKLSSRPGSHADLHLSARVDDTAQLTLDGQVDPLGSDVFTDLALISHGIDLGPLGPYSARYLGFALDRGRLDLEMRYRLENRVLQGSNLLVANPFLLGEKTDSPDSINLPVRLGLALLRDRQGAVRLDVPVEGNLDDPRFRLGRVILRAVVNVFTKLVASPFTLLARAFAGKEVDLSVIDFQPGAAALTDDARGRLDTLAKALTERPDLTLAIAGAVDAGLDPDGLRRTRLDSLVRAEKWSSLRRREREQRAVEDVAVEPGEYPKFLKAAWKVFREGHPDEAGDEKPETPAEMEAWILARIAIGPPDLSELAAARARVVRDYLAAASIETQRLFLKQGEAQDSARALLELQ